MSQGGVPGGGVVKLLKQIPSVECKFFDLPLTAGTFATGWSDISTQGGPTSPFSGIVQGTGPSQRIGRKIRVIGIVVRLIAIANGAPLAFDLVVDKQCNGTTAATNQVYLTPADPASFPNPFEETRFQFLKRVENKNYALALNGAGEFTVSYTVKCNKMVEYNATTGAVGDLTSDNLILFACATSTAVLQKIQSGQIRVLYVDA
jgi:Satellite tobacco necrosis virus coat protein.